MIEKPKKAKCLSPTNKIQESAKQPWQRPQLQKLHISLDTMNRPGSGTDFMMVGSGTV